MTKLSSADFTAASKAIEKHAKETCKVDLSVHSHRWQVSWATCPRDLLSFRSGRGT